MLTTRTGSTRDLSRLAAMAMAVGGLGVMAVLGMWVSGAAGATSRSMWSALAFASVAMGAGWLLWRGQSGWLAVGAVLAVAGVGVGVWHAANVPLGRGRLRSAMDEMFPQAIVSGTDVDGGNVICFDECPFVSRTWVVPGPAGDVQARLGEELQAAGFITESWRPAVPAGGVELHGYRGRVGVSVRVREEPAGSEGIEVTVVMGTH